MWPTHHRLSYSGNTTNLFYHLEAKHKSQFSRVTPKKKMVILSYSSTQTVTHTPVLRLVTHTPVFRLVTHTPVFRLVTHTPVLGLVTHTSVIRLVTHTPVFRLVTHTPVLRLVTPYSSTQTGNTLLQYSDW